MKYEKLEERIRGDGTPGYIETSVGFKTAVTIIGNPSQSPENNMYSPRSPEYNASQGFTPAGTTTNYPPTQSPENNTFQEFKTTAIIPTYTPQSPEYSVPQGFTPAGTTTNYPPPQSQECSTSPGFNYPPPQSPACSTSPGFNVDFLQRLAGGIFPLQGELNALSELVDSMRADLLQTTMIINYAKDFLKNYEFN